MSRPTIANRWNLDAIEDAYDRWRQDPNAVDPSWRNFFDGYELAASRDGRAGKPQPVAAPDLTRLVDGYRRLGHFQAHLDPLNPPPKPYPLLTLTEFGFSDADLDREFGLNGLFGLNKAKLGALVQALQQTYCRKIGVEFMHIQDPRIRQWLIERMEPIRNRPDLPRRLKFRILTRLHYAEIFERFLHSRFPGQKRFSLEGAETLIPIFDAIVEKSPELGIREIVMGTSHRGRLNVLANILQKPYELIFAEFEGSVVPDSIAGDGDVKYHLGFSSDYVTAKEGKVHLSLAANPSHLEAVDPVVEGRVRAKQRKVQDWVRKTGLPLLIHGDAAFAGQGLVAETLNLSQLRGYKTGGTIHVVVNNQIGFTTSPSDARSTTYCTDIIKMLEVPIFHVNGEDPEACVYVAELSLDFRQTFGKDVAIDMFCYRRHGHNEGDEPSFTQPLMYRNIKDRPSLREVYTEQLIMRGDLTVEETEALDTAFQEKLQKALDEVRTDGKTVHEPPGFHGVWTGFTPVYDPAPVVTGVDRKTLEQITLSLASVPDSVHVHPKVQRVFEARLKQFQERNEVDWPSAEALAYGSLVLEGFPVRLSGQDSRRGTFSQRHAVLYDTENGEMYLPLNHLREGQAEIAVYDSHLSEAAVLGFEYGYSLDEPNVLIQWEAQFGDFVNGAQVIIDQFIAAGESKWRRASGVVLLLPHGYEGQGPEHSSARLERFLQLCAEDNMQVCNPTTPAQYFHLLRRQMHRKFRKPLVIMTPKSLLRHKRVVSPVEALTKGGFREVIPETEKLHRVRRVLLCSGKVYYDLLEKRESAKIEDVAIVRVEQFYPFPVEPLKRVIADYAKAREWVWVQEESQNMGGWFFMEPRLRQLLNQPVAYVGRDASASPATGSLRIHQREQKEIVDAALSGEVPHLVRTV